MPTEATVLSLHVRKPRPWGPESAYLLGGRAGAEAQDCRVYIKAIFATGFLHWGSLTANSQPHDLGRITELRASGSLSVTQGHRTT